MNVNKILLLSLTTSSLLGSDLGWDIPLSPRTEAIKEITDTPERKIKTLQANNTKLDRERHEAVMKVAELESQIAELTELATQASDLKEQLNQERSQANSILSEKNKLEQKLNNQIAASKQELDKAKESNAASENNANRLYKVLEENFDNLNNKYNKFKIYSGLAIVGSILTTAFLMTEKVQNKIKQTANKVKKSFQKTPRK